VRLAQRGVVRIGSDAHHEIVVDACRSTCCPARMKLTPL
jgi:hypothetical protein